MTMKKILIIGVLALLLLPIASALFDVDEYYLYVITGGNATGGNYSGNVTNNYYNLTLGLVFNVSNSTTNGGQTVTNNSIIRFLGGTYMSVARNGTNFTFDWLGYPLITALNTSILTKLNATDQRYNETSKLNALNLSKSGIGNCGSGKLVQNLTSGLPQCVPIANATQSSIYAIETYLGQDAADGNARETWDYIDVGTTPSTINTQKTFIFDFTKPNINRTYGRWAIDWTCINYGHGEIDAQLAEIAIGYPSRQIKNISSAIGIINQTTDLKGDVSIKFRYRTGMPYTACDTSGMVGIGGGFLGNLTLGIGNISKTFDLRMNFSVYDWTTLKFENVSLTSKSAMDNQINPYNFLWAVVRQDTDTSTCFPIGVQYYSCWDVESMTIEQYR